MRRALLTFGCAALAAMLAVAIILQDGAAWRIPQDRLYPSSEEMRGEESALCRGSDRLNGIDLGSRTDEPLVTCAYDRNADKDIYVWGDSHARHLLAGLIAAYPDHNIHIMYFTSCLSQSGIGKYFYGYKGRTALSEGCVDRNHRAMAFFRNQPPASIIMHQYFGYEGQFDDAWYAATQDIFDALEGWGHHVAFVGGVPRPGVSVAECVAVPATISDAHIEDRCRPSSVLSREIIQWNAEVAARFPERYLDVSPIFCTQDGTCRGTDGSILLFRDAHHLTLYGARRLIAAIRPQLSRLPGIDD